MGWWPSHESGDKGSEAFDALWEEVGASVICAEDMSHLNVSEGTDSEYADEGTAAGLKGKMPDSAKPALTFAGVIARSHTFANKTWKGPLCNFVAWILG